MLPLIHAVCLIFSISQCFCYIFDVKYSYTYDVNRTGYLATFLQQTADGFRLVVGVPKEDRVLVCSPSTCKNFSDKRKNPAGYELLGAAIDGGGNQDDPVYVCAPRFIVLPSYRVNGRCFAIEKNTFKQINSLDHAFSQIQIFNNTYEYYYAHGQAGFSIKYVNRNEFVLGAPGVLSWAGTIIKHTSHEEKQVLHPEKVVQRNSYLGYSIEYGNFYFAGIKKRCIIAGAPRDDNLMGQILKPTKPRHPLGELDLGNQEDPDDQTNNLNKTNRRVSFASSNLVKPFLTDPEKNTIWDLTYEESIEKSESSQSTHSNTNKENIHNYLNTTTIANYSFDMMDFTTNIGVINENCANIVSDGRDNCIVENINLIDTDVQMDFDNDMELTVPINTVKINTRNKIDCDDNLEVSMEQTEMVPISIIQESQNVPIICKTDAIDNLEVSMEETEIVPILISNRNQDISVDNTNNPKIGNPILCETDGTHYTEVSMDETETIPIIINNRNKDISVDTKNNLRCIESVSTSFDDTEKLINYNLSNIKKSDFSKIISGDIVPPFINVSSMLLRGINSTSFVESGMKELSSKCQQNVDEKNANCSMENLNTLVDSTGENPNNMSISEGAQYDKIHEDTVNHEIVDMEMSYENDDVFISSIIVTPSSQKNSANSLINKNYSSKSFKENHLKSANLNTSDNRLSEKYDNDRSVDMEVSDIGGSNTIPNVIITPSTPENVNTSFDKYIVQTNQSTTNEISPKDSNIKENQFQEYGDIVNKTPNEVGEHQNTENNKSVDNVIQEPTIWDRIKPIDLTDMDRLKEDSIRIEKKEKAFVDRMTNVLHEVDVLCKKEVEVYYQIKEALDYVDSFKSRLEDNRKKKHTEEVTVGEPKSLSWNDRISLLHKRSQEYWNVISLDDKLCKFNTLYGTIAFTVQINNDNGIVLDIELEDRISEKSQTIALYIHNIFMEKLKLTPIQSALGENFDILSLLDYVQLTMEKLLEIDKDFTYLSTRHAVCIDPSFNVTFAIISVDFMFSWRFTVNASECENINAESVTYYAKVGELRERDIKKCMQGCPKGFAFIRAFVKNLLNFVEVLENNL